MDAKLYWKGKQVMFIKMYLILFIFSIFASILQSKILLRFLNVNTKTSKNIPNIDGIRGYLSLSVMTHHYFIWIQSEKFNIPWSPPSNPFLNMLGIGSVHIFFMITGFLFYPKAIEGFNLNNLAHLYLGRFLRIFPATLFSIFFCTIISFYQTDKLTGYNYFLVFINWISGYSEPPIFGYSDSWKINSYVLWSIWYEWIFYFTVLPAVAITISISDKINFGRIKIITLLLLVTGLAAINQYLKYKNNGICLYLSLFLSGMLVCEIYHRKPLREFFSNKITMLISVGGFLVILFNCKESNIFTLPVILLFFCCIVCCNDRLKIFTNIGIRRIGKISFSVYLFHGILIYVIFKSLNYYDKNYSLLLCFTLLPIIFVLVILFSSLSYCAIERPFERMRKSSISSLSL